MIIFSLFSEEYSLCPLSFHRGICIGGPLDLQSNAAPLSYTSYIFLSPPYLIVVYLLPAKRGY